MRAVPGRDVSRSFEPEGPPDEIEETLGCSLELSGLGSRSKLREVASKRILLLWQSMASPRPALARAAADLNLELLRMYEA